MISRRRITVEVSRIPRCEATPSPAHTRASRTASTSARSAAASTAGRRLQRSSSCSGGTGPGGSAPELGDRDPGTRDRDVLAGGRSLDDVTSTIAQVPDAHVSHVMQCITRDAPTHGIEGQGSESLRARKALRMWDFRVPRARAGIRSMSRICPSRPRTSVSSLCRERRYFPVGRCIAARVCPARPRPAPTPPRAAPRTGGGVRRRRSRSARSSGPSSVRSVSVLGWTTRNTGPRPGSTTATMTFDLLGVSNTIPSSSGPPSATFTSSPALVGSIDAAYCDRRSPPPSSSRRGGWFR